MNTGHLGAVAEAQFLIKALALGWEVSVPFNRSSSYDFVIRREAESPWETVQVKKAYFGKRGSRKTDVLEVGFRRSSRTAKSRMQPYKTGDFDLLFAFHEAGCWMIPWSEIKDRKSVVQVGGRKYERWNL